MTKSRNTSPSGGRLTLHHIVLSTHLRAVANRHHLARSSTGVQPSLEGQQAARSPGGVRVSAYSLLRVVQIGYGTKVGGGAQSVRGAANYYKISKGGAVRGRVFASDLEGPDVCGVACEDLDLLPRRRAPQVDASFGPACVRTHRRTRRSASRGAGWSVSRLEVEQVRRCAVETDMCVTSRPPGEQGPGRLALLRRWLCSSPPLSTPQHARRYARRYAKGAEARSTDTRCRACPLR